MPVIWPPLCVRHLLEWVSVTAPRGIERVLERAWHKEEKKWVFKPPKKISVFVCGQQWHSKLSIGPNRLELILPSPCLCMIRKRTFTEYLQHYSFFLSVKFYQNATYPGMTGHKRHLSYEGTNSKWTISYFWPLDSLKQCLSIYRSIFQKKKQSIICFPERLLITLSNICAVACV